MITKLVIIENTSGKKYANIFNSLIFFCFFHFYGPIPKKCIVNI